MNVKLADLLIDKRQCYRIEGVDHLEFDPEWAEEGGWIILSSIAVKPPTLGGGCKAT